MIIHIPFPFLALAFIAIWALVRWRTYTTWRREALMTMFLIYLLGVLYVTMDPFIFQLFPGDYRGFSFDTQLFHELTHMAPGYLDYQLLYTVGNIVMTLPLGIFVPLLWRTCRRFWMVIIIGFLFSFTIETTQGLFTIYRQATVDDLFFNTIGAWIGYVIWFIVFKRRSK